MNIYFNDYSIFREFLEQGCKRIKEIEENLNNKDKNIKEKAIKEMFQIQANTGKSLEEMNGKILNLIDELNFDMKNITPNIDGGQIKIYLNKF